MARIAKAGLDYYPQNVDFLYERLIRRMIRKHGIVSVVMIMALESHIYGEKGYYMEWNEDICFDLSEIVNTDMEKVHAIVADLIREGMFCREQFKENGILTSEEIQKQYLACTTKRKSVVIKEEYKLIETEPTASPKPSPKEREQEPCGPDSGYSNSISTLQTTIWGEETAVPDTKMQENGGGVQQSKVKEIESKEKQSKAKQTTPTPPGEGGNLAPANAGKDEGGKVLFNGRWVPQYCLNKRTHNYDGLLERLNQIHVTDMKDVNNILERSAYGKIGHPLWGIISYSNWPKGNTIKYPGKYILSQLKQLG